MEAILEEFQHDQRELIHILHTVQSELGYISPEAISAVARHLGCKPDASTAQTSINLIRY